MTLEELEEALEELMPGFSLGVDDNGQVIIYTNLAESEDGELVDLDDVDDASIFDDDTEQLDEDEDYDD